MPLQRLLSAILVSLGLLFAACTPPTLPAAPSKAPAPTPVQIQVWDGAAMRTFAPGESGFVDLSAALAELLANTGARARTFYTPTRFQEEITVRPYFLADYGQVVTVEGQELSFQAQRLVVVVVDGEFLVLAQTEIDGDWSVFLPAQPDAASRFEAAVKAATGVDLRSE